MNRRPPGSTRTYSLFPDTPLVRSEGDVGRDAGGIGRPPTHRISVQRLTGEGRDVRVVGLQPVELERYLLSGLEQQLGSAGIGLAIAQRLVEEDIADISIVAQGDGRNAREPGVRPVQRARGLSRALEGVVGTCRHGKRTSAGEGKRV